jgi:hypothetical protein
MFDPSPDYFMDDYFIPEYFVGENDAVSIPELWC